MYARIIRTAALAILGFAAQAQADLLTVWVTAKQQHLQGIEYTYGPDNVRPVDGVEAGIELFHVDIYAQATKVQEGHYFLTANIGADATVGDAVRFTFGVDTGAILTMKPEGETGGFEMPSQVRSALTAAGADAGEVERTLGEQFETQAKDVSRFGLGWNILKARMQLETEVLPFVYLGVGGQAGYHYYVDGETIAGDAKERMVTQLESGYRLDDMGPGLGQQLRDATGAKPFEPADHFGFNYEAGAYLKIEL